MDSSQRDIPIVEDDMGEGYSDPIEGGENAEDKKQREIWKLEEKLKQLNKTLKEEEKNTNQSAGEAILKRLEPLTPEALEWGRRAALRDMKEEEEADARQTTD